MEQHGFATRAVHAGNDIETDSVIEQALREKEHLVALRREFHGRPELALREYETAKRIKRELGALDIPHTRVWETGVLGILRGAGGYGRAADPRGDRRALPSRTGRARQGCGPRRSGGLALCAVDRRRGRQHPAVRSLPHYESAVSRAGCADRRCAPETYNRIVPAAWMEGEDIAPYAFGPEKEREAVLLFNAGTELTAEKTVEYMI